MSCNLSGTCTSKSLLATEPQVFLLHISFGDNEILLVRKRFIQQPLMMENNDGRNGSSQFIFQPQVAYLGPAAQDGDTV